MKQKNVIRNFILPGAGIRAQQLDREHSPDARTDGDTQVGEAVTGGR